ncbi:hypothetical protein [Microcoleus sp. D3_18_C4]|uniref:hypothetical protein n=1 Tax=Microcoleus sp. D3_18_C4 TaxID=3055335 RepID=UPI002FD2B39D
MNVYPNSSKLSYARLKKSKELGHKPNELEEVHGNVSVAASDRLRGRDKHNR